MIELYGFQKQAVNELLNGKKIAVMPTGSGKTAVMFNWLKALNPDKVLIITVASKVKSGDFVDDADVFAGDGWKDNRTFEIISWHKLNKWYKENLIHAKEYVVAFDEVHSAGAGVSSLMGRTFIELAKKAKDWAGFTATPGDNWMKMHPYFVANRQVRCKTEFMNEFVKVNRYKGFPEIAGFLHEDKLENMWDSISTIPNTEQMFRDLPDETHQTIEFDKPKGYDKVMKTSKTLDDEPLESNIALCHYLRQMCSSKDKLEWTKDWIAGLSSSAVIFYNYKAEREEIENICKKLKRKVWRIDGQKHEIPTAETIGKNDIVLAHYASGSASLNLQFLHYWLSYSPNYSYTISIQARGRIKRIGQQHNMFFYYLKTNGTIEEAVYKALKEKRDFSEDVWMASRK